MASRWPADRSRTRAGSWAIITGNRSPGAARKTWDSKGKPPSCCASGSTRRKFTVWNLPEPSGQNAVHHLTVHVRQPALDTVVVVRQPLVVQAEQVKNGRVEIVNGHRVLAG